MNTLTRRKRIPRQGSAAEREAKRRANFGTKARHRWWYEQVCACEGLHPACSGGSSDPSHTRSKAVEGDESTIIPQSRGCHDYIGSQGWSKWEREVAANFGPHVLHVVKDEQGYRLDRDALAEHWSKLGPDAPGVTS